MTLPHASRRRAFFARSTVHAIAAFFVFASSCGGTERSVIAESADSGARVVKLDQAAGCGCEGGGAAHAPIACFVPTCEPGGTRYELQVGPSGSELEAPLVGVGCVSPQSVELSAAPNGERVAYRCSPDGAWNVVYVRASELVTRESAVPGDAALDWEEVASWPEAIEGLEVPAPDGDWLWFLTVVRVGYEEGHDELGTLLARAAAVEPEKSWYTASWCPAARVVVADAERSAGFVETLTETIAEGGADAVEPHLQCEVLAALTPHLLARAPARAAELLARMSVGGARLDGWCEAASTVRAHPEAGQGFVRDMQELLAREDLDEAQRSGLERFWVSCDFGYEHVQALVDASDAESVSALMITFDLAHDPRWCEAAEGVLADEARASQLLDAVVARIDAQPETGAYPREPRRRLECDAVQSELTRRAESRDPRVLELMTRTADDERIDNWWCEIAGALHAEDRTALAERLDALSVEPESPAASGLARRRRCLE